MTYLNSIHNELITATLTPMGNDFNPDIDRFLKHINNLLKNNIDGILIFGTTGEGNSFSLKERKYILEGIGQSVSCSNILVGAGSCAFKDVAELSKQAVRAQCRGVLLLPPFYYKNVSEDGLFGFFDSVIKEVGEKDFKIYLYHIPQISGISITSSLLEKLLKHHPGTIAGIKDSGGNVQQTIEWCKNFPELNIYTGNETFYWDTIRNGGRGCISATFNYSAFLGLQNLNDNQTDLTVPDAEKIIQIRNIITSFPVIPALKFLISEKYQDPGWEIVRPPLVPLTEKQKLRLKKELQGISAWI